MRSLLHFLGLVIWIVCTLICATILTAAAAGFVLDKKLVLLYGIPAVAYLASLAAWQLTKAPEKVDKIINKQKKE